jgi:hypothetical protein
MAVTRVSCNLNPKNVFTKHFYLIYSNCFQKCSHSSIDILIAWTLDLTATAGEEAIKEK